MVPVLAVPVDVVPLELVAVEVVPVLDVPVEVVPVEVVLAEPPPPFPQRRGASAAGLRPHLTVKIDHALRTRGGKKGDESGPDHFSKGAVADMLGGTPAKTDRRIPRNIPPPKSTERQATAMRKLAAAFTRKKK